MKRVARNGLIAVAVAGGAMASVGVAYADAGASGGTAGSPGVLSGNTVQIPVHVPINVCGNTVNVVGALNPAANNTCTNGAGQSGGGASAVGQAQDSPGVVSGNDVQVPIDVPVNATGNSVNVIGIGNAATGNESSNGSGSGTVSGPVLLPDTPPVSLPDMPPVSLPDMPPVSCGCGNDQPVSLPDMPPVLLPDTPPVSLPDVPSVSLPDMPPVSCGCGNDQPVSQPQSPVSQPQPQSPVSVPNENGTPATQPQSPVSVPNEDGTPETVGGSPDGGDDTQLTSAGHPLGDSAATLAHTGADSLILAFPAGLALLGGTILYRRFRSAALA
ncbi:chaplin family protein [Streptomyces sp. NPDC002577]